MTRWLKFLFETDKHPVRRLLWLEWVMLGYMAVTLLMMLFMATKVVNPGMMFWGRFRILVSTLAMWGVYRMVPCRLTMMLRVALQLALLSWWSPDTYELNRTLPNLDHLFAGMEQRLFGCQPALLFAQRWSHPVVSELMDMGYTSYYPLIVLVSLFYFLCRNTEFLKAEFVILGSFFAYYLIFIVLPVTGPQFYYLAVGTDAIAHGVFPPMGDYFATHQEAMAVPGYTDGLFYQLVCDAHDAGERPTAAFPSSHVGVTTVLMLLAWKTRNRRLFLFMLPFFLLMCLSTVYIMAHYAIDVLAGLVTGVLIFLILYTAYDLLLEKREI